MPYIVYVEIGNSPDFLFVYFGEAVVTASTTSFFFAGVLWRRGDNDRVKISQPAGSPSEILGVLLFFFFPSRHSLGSPAVPSLLVCVDYFATLSIGREESEEICFELTWYAVVVCGR